jgi:hypothetical protein
LEAGITIQQIMVFHKECHGIVIQLVLELAISLCLPVRETGGAPWLQTINIIRHRLGFLMRLVERLRIRIQELYGIGYDKKMKNMKKIVLIIVFTWVQLNAQTGIGTTTPNASAKLEVYATNKGFLPPRIALTGTLDAVTIASPATGLVIYNTVTAGTSPNNVLPGYYYWDGAKWNGLVDQGTLQSFSGYVPNYAQSNASSVTKSATGDIVVSQSITTSGRPVQIIATGDANPALSGAWVQLQLFRDNTAIGKKVQAESSSNNENIPYCLNFIDNPTTPGTYNYSVRIVGGGAGGFGFGESDGNHITLLELGAWSAGTMPVAKGGTGSSSYTNGSVLFSDGTKIDEKNAQLFWDNTNNRLGIGTSSPTSKLNIAGGGIKIASGLGNSSTRPNLNTSTIGNYEIRGVGGGSPQIDGQDDGFLRLSAGGGTNVNTQSSIDISGYSTVADMSSTIVMRTGGSERLRIDPSGNVNISGKLNIGDATGNVAVKAAGFVNESVPVTLGDIQVQMAPNGSARSLQIKTTGTAFTAMVSAYTTYNGASGTNSFTYFSDITQNINTVFAHLGTTWGFAQSGDVANYFVRDSTNLRFWRITLMVGPSYFNNFISIERLL